MPGTRILTRHPRGLKGVNIDRARYDVVREAPLGALAGRGEATFSELATELRRTLGRTFTGSIPWYAVTVKLDLEARGLIGRVPRTAPQRLRLTAAGTRAAGGRSRRRRR